MIEHETYWEDRWQQEQTGWDLGAVSPPIAAYVDQLSDEKRRSLRVMIPGCGNGYEALYLLNTGFQHIYMLDIAPTAIEQLKNRLDVEGPADWPERLHLICEDFFQHQGAYDLILEQTFFCALSPSLRRDYVLKMKDLLAPGGQLAGLLFDRDFPGGPPFGGSKAEYETLFFPHFSVKTMDACHNSISPRSGSELWINLQRH